MAAKLGSIYVALDVDIGRVSKFRDAANTIDRDSARIRNSLNGTSRSVTGLQRQMSSNFRSRMFGDALQTISRTNDELSRLKATFMALSAVTGTGLTGALAATFLLQTADRARLLSNQLKTVTTSSENLAAVQERLYNISQDSRAGLQSTVTIYARTARAAESLGLSQEKLLKVTETVQKAFSVGGASQQEATGAAIQLSQAIASNRFSGDEFRSVAENAPVLLQGIAKSLGVNIGKLREMGQQGLLTSEMVIKGILGASDGIESAFEKTTSTVGQSLTKLDNAFLMYIGNADHSEGVTRRLASAISGLAANFSEVAKYSGYAIGGGVALLAGRFLSGKLGGALTNAAAQRKAHMDELDALRKEQLALQAQGVQLVENIHLTETKAALAEQATNKQLLSLKKLAVFEASQAKYEAQINAMKAEGVAISQRQVAVSTEMALVQRKASIASKIGSGVLGFFGGPVGVAFTAAIVGATMYGDAAAKAQERTYGLKKELFDLGLTADLTGEKIADSAKSIDDLSDAAARSKLADVNDELNNLKSQQNVLDKVFNFNPDNISQILSDLMATERRGFAGLSSEADTKAAQQIEQMVRDVQDGKVKASELKDQFEAIARTPISDPMAQLLERASKAVQYMGGLLALSDQLNAKFSSVGTQNFSRGALGQQRAKSAVANKVTDDYLAELARVAALNKHDSAVEVKMKSIEKDMPDGAAPLSKDRLREIADGLVTLDEKANAADKATTKAGEAAKKYADGLAKLNAEVEVAPLSKFYQQVVSSAEGLGIGTDEIHKFIDAVKSNDLDAAPKKIKDIADAMRDVAAANIKESIAWDRSMMFQTDGEQKIAETLRDAGIEAGSAYGKMISGQMRYNAFLGEAKTLAVDFGQTFRQSFVDRLMAADTAHEEARITHISDLIAEAQKKGTDITIQQRKAILEMAESMADAEHGATALERTMNAVWGALGDAGAKALETIASKLMEMGTLGLLQSLTGGGAPAGGGGGGGGILGMLFSAITGALGGGGNFIGGSAGAPALQLGYQVGVGHSGGIVGQLGQTRAVPMSMFADAPRLHSGGVLGSKEVPVIGLEGEEMGMPSDLAKKYGGGTVNHFHIDARGAQKGVGAEIADALSTFERNRLPMAIDVHEKKRHRKG